MRLNQLRKIGITVIFLRQFLDVEQSGLGIKDYIKVKDDIGNIKNAVDLIKSAHKQGFN